MAALVREWKKWIPEMTIIQEETVVDQPKRVKEKKDKEEKPDHTPFIPMSDAERFVKRVTDIFNKVETRNGQRINTSPRGHEGSYTFAVDVTGINKALDDLLKNHKAKIDDYLERQTKLRGYDGRVSFGRLYPEYPYDELKVCCKNSADISFALKDFYGESTAVNYLSKSLKTLEAELMQKTPSKDC